MADGRALAVASGGVNASGWRRTAAKCWSAPLLPLYARPSGQPPSSLWTSLWVGGMRCHRGWIADTRLIQATSELRSAVSMEKE